MFTKTATLTAVLLALSAPAYAAGTDTQLAQSGPTTTSPGQPPGQTSGQTQAQTSGQATTQGSTAMSEELKSAMQASNVIGKNVQNAQGENLGEIDDLLIDKDGSIRAAVVSVGGFLGVGDRNVAIDWKEVSFSPQGDTITVNLTKEELQNAPEFREERAERPAEGSGQTGARPGAAPGAGPTGAPGSPAPRQ